MERPKLNPPENTNPCPRCEGHGDLYGKDGLTDCPFCAGTGRKATQEVKEVI